MNTIDFVNNMKETAEKGVRKICGRNTCIAPYASCDHKNHKDVSMPAIGTNTTCPLAHYNQKLVEDDRPYWKVPSSEVTPTTDEMFAICAMCPHGRLAEDSEGLLVHRENLYDTCLDCPVKIVEEAMQEMAGEGACYS